MNETETKVKTKLNLPNKLIIVRFSLSFVLLIVLILIPYSIKWGFYFVIFKDSSATIFISYLNIIALIIFLSAAYTDYLDGHLARKNDQVTNFGKLFDPVADKILVNTTLIFFAAYSYIPIWVVALFIARDIFVDGLRMNLASKGEVLAADRFGKFKTLFQIIGITILFIFHPPGNEIDQSQAIFSYNYHSLLTISAIPLYIGLFFSLYSGIKYYKNGWELIF